MTIPRPLLNMAYPHTSNKLIHFPLSVVEPNATHTQLPADDPLSSTFSGLESATTEWPGLGMWSSRTADNTWDANAASGNQCCNIPFTTNECTDAQALRPASTSIQDGIDKVEGSLSPPNEPNQPMASRSPQWPRRYVRTIVSATALRLLHITIDMHRHLGLCDMYPKRSTAGRRRNVCTVNLATSATNAIVVMVRTASKGQHHRRFSTGWREFCVQAGVEIGDEVVFERVENANMLTVHVEKKCH